MIQQKITPFLWFDDQAEEAAKLYTSVFKNSRINSVTRYNEAGPGPTGAVMMVSFQLDGQEFLALNGGLGAPEGGPSPEFPFTEAISFLVNCETQEEIDKLWAKLSEGGEEGQCGWLKDKFGLSWQITPTVLGEMLQDEDREKASRVTEAMLQTGKIDIATLKQAYEASPVQAS